MKHTPHHFHVHQPTMLDATGCPMRVGLPTLDATVCLKKLCMRIGLSEAETHMCFIYVNKKFIGIEELCCLSLLQCPL